jgi:hypothetical protein
MKTAGFYPNSVRDYRWPNMTRTCALARIVFYYRTWDASDEPTFEDLYRALTRIIL